MTIQFDRSVQRSQLTMANMLWWCHTKAATWPLQTPWLPACFSLPLTCSCGDRIHLLQPRPVIHCLESSSSPGSPLQLEIWNSPQLLTHCPTTPTFRGGINWAASMRRAFWTVPFLFQQPINFVSIVHLPRNATSNALPFILGFPTSAHLYCLEQELSRMPGASEGNFHVFARSHWISSWITSQQFSSETFWALPLQMSHWATWMSESCGPDGSMIARIIMDCPPRLA